MNLSIEFDSNPEVVMVICKKKKKRTNGSKLD